MWITDCDACDVGLGAWGERHGPRCRRHAACGIHGVIGVSNKQPQAAAIGARGDVPFVFTFIRTAALRRARVRGGSELTCGSFFRAGVLLLRVFWVLLDTSGFWVLLGSR